MVLKIVRVILLLFSMYGYTQYLVSKRKLKIELALPVLLSAIGAAVFLAGLLNVMKEVSALIFLFGAVFGVVSLKRRYALRELFTVGTVICAVMAAVLLFLTYGVKFTQYDNLSHWSVAVRLLVTENRFPNFEDTVVFFQSYPVGSASLMYYFAKITGIRSEWFYIWTQQIATVCFAGSLFAFCQKKKPVEYGATTLAVFCLLFCVPGFSILSEILVDELLACLGVAGAAVCLFYREDLQKLLFALVPINIFLVAIKNSGAFFASVLSVYFLFLVVKSGKIKVHISFKSILAVISPFIVMYLWKQHVAFSFVSGMETKHSMSLDNFKHIFAKKSPELISQVTESFLKRMFAFDNPFLIILIALLAALLIIKIRKLQIPQYKETVALIIGTYLIYMIGNYGMYIFSMPNYEASILACYDRYHMTGVAFVAGILFILLLEIYHAFGKGSSPVKAKTVLWRAAYIAAAAVTVWFAITPVANSFKRASYEGSKRQQLDSVVEKYRLDVSGNRSFAVIWDFNDSDYTFFLTRYVLNTGNIKEIDPNTPGDLQAKIRGYDYLVVPEHNAAIDAFLTQHFGNCSEDAYSLT